MATESTEGITKPAGFGLERFKSKRAAAMANVETLLPGLPHHPLKEANDFVRLHHDENRFWTQELCFVSVPIRKITE